MSYFTVFGTVERIDTTRINTFLGLFGQIRPVAVLSTGHKVILHSSLIERDNPDDNIQVGRSYFFGCSGKNATSQLFVETYRLCTELDKLDVLASNLADASKRAIHATLTLNSRDRGLVFNAVGITVAGTFSAINAINTVGCLASGLTGTLEPTSALTGAVVSGTISIASGVYTYLQYEQLNENLKSRASAVDEYVKAHKLYSKLMNKYIPCGYADAEPLNPEVRSLITTLRTQFTMGLDSAKGIQNFMKANIHFQVA